MTKVVCATAACSFALATSVWGWLPHFIPLPVTTFLALTAALGLALALVVMRDE